MFYFVFQSTFNKYDIIKNILAILSVHFVSFAVKKP